MAAEVHDPTLLAIIRAFTAGFYSGLLVANGEDPHQRLCEALDTFLQEFRDGVVAMVRTTEQEH